MKYEEGSVEGSVEKFYGYNRGDSKAHRTGFHHGVAKALEILEAGGSVEAVAKYELIARYYRTKGGFEPDIRVVL